MSSWRTARRARQQRPVQLDLSVEPVEVKFCPACKGAGELVDYDPRFCEGLLHRCCRMCKGTGVVPKVHDPETAPIPF